MELTSFVMTPFMENCYVLKDGGEAVVIDPGECNDALLQSLDGCRVTAIINTHCHIDHVGGNAGVKAHTGADLLCPEGEVEMLRSVPEQGMMFGVQVPPSPEPDGFLKAGDTIRVGEVELSVRSAPGHSPDHMILAGNGFVIGGDVLFQGSIGRTDLPGGDYDTLLRSIQREMLSLDDDTVVYSGHGPETTIGAERKSNPFLVGLA